MVWLKAGKKLLKEGLKTKKGKELTAAALKKTGITQKQFNSVSNFFKTKPDFKSALRTKKSKNDNALGVAAALTPAAGIYGISEMVGEKNRKKAIKKIIEESNAATKADAIAKIQKATSAAQKFKNRVKK